MAARTIFIIFFNVFVRLDFHVAILLKLLIVVYISFLKEMKDKQALPFLLSFSFWLQYHLI